MNRPWPIIAVADVTKRRLVHDLIAGSREPTWSESGGWTA